ncbi:hypothetical protein PM082_023002 [Marasmius tenuissimus]|nr:hypothetical protein PM082_023002 [Marasmius tenuissimus]
MKVDLQLLGRSLERGFTWGSRKMQWRVEITAQAVYIAATRAYRTHSRVSTSCTSHDGEGTCLQQLSLAAHRFLALARVGFIRTIVIMEESKGWKENQSHSSHKCRIPLHSSVSRGS